jgi:type II secretory pathway component PulC
MKLNNFVSFICLPILWVILTASQSSSTQTAQTAFNWSLLGTVLVDNDHAMAILENKKSGQQKWVSVGTEIDRFKVTRISRNKVMVSDGSQEIILSSGTQGGSLPLSIHTPSAVNMAEVNKGQDVDAILNEEFERHYQNPVPLPEADRRIMVKELSKVLTEGKIIPASYVVHIGEGEELVNGMKTVTNIQGMGLQGEDIIIHINGITPDSKERWDDIMSILRTAQLITLSFIREGRIYSYFWGVQ